LILLAALSVSVIAQRKDDKKQSDDQKKEIQAIVKTVDDTGATLLAASPFLSETQWSHTATPASASTLHALSIGAGEAHQVSVHDVGAAAGHPTSSPVLRL